MHVLSGGQIPGVPKRTLDLIISRYMKKIANAAEQANGGHYSDETRHALPPLSALPKQFINSVANGNALPGEDSRT
jgi:hypothetical protein